MKMQCIINTNTQTYNTVQYMHIPLVKYSIVMLVCLSAYVRPSLWYHVQTVKYIVEILLPPGVLCFLVRPNDYWYPCFIPLTVLLHSTQCNSRSFAVLRQLIQAQKVLISRKLRRMKYYQIVGGEVICRITPFSMTLSYLREDFCHSYFCIWNGWLRYLQWSNYEGA